MVDDLLVQWKHSSAISRLHHRWHLYKQEYLQVTTESRYLRISFFTGCITGCFEHVFMCFFFSLPLTGGEVLPVPWRAANEDVENVNLATRGIQVRAAHLHAHKHLNAVGVKCQSRREESHYCFGCWKLNFKHKSFALALTLPVTCWITTTTWVNVIELICREKVCSVTEEAFCR